MTEILLPGLSADLLSSRFPFLQASNRDPGCSGKGFPSQPQRLPIGPDTVSLSIIEETIEFIHEIRHRNPIEARQLFRHRRLQESFAVSAPTKPVRDIPNFLISAIPLIELGSIQNFPRGAKYETVYE